MQSQKSTERTRRFVVRGRGRNEADRKRAFVVSLTDGTPDATLLPEHVLQTSALRNTLSYVPTEGVDSIRYVTSDDAVDTALMYLKAVGPVGASRFGFRGYTFEASKDFPSY
jgi:hypothetical protein